MAIITTASASNRPENALAGTGASSRAVLEERLEEPRAPLEGAGSAVGFLPPDALEADLAWDAGLAGDDPALPDLADCCGAEGALVPALGEVAVEALTLGGVALVPMLCPSRASALGTLGRRVAMTLL
ncbi:hypothetical protein [Arthrobacter sp. SIMBA_036]|uniref:hypothetical protein n=1 Tax=Arthrobacter sp. SIMBA_036 TaxID=3085778 RepID=UPI00397E3598